MIEYTRYLSCDGEDSNVTLSPIVSGDHEKWIIYNDFVPEMGECLQSGGYTSNNCFLFVN